MRRVERVLNDKAASKKMAYGYYPKLLKEYGSALPWINQTLENKLEILRQNVHLHL